MSLKWWALVQVLCSWVHFIRALAEGREGQKVPVSDRCKRVTVQFHKFHTSFFLLRFLLPPPCSPFNCISFRFDGAAMAIRHFLLFYVLSGTRAGVGKLAERFTCVCVFYIMMITFATDSGVSYFTVLLWNLAHYTFKRKRYRSPVQCY